VALLTRAGQSIWIGTAARLSSHPFFTPRYMFSRHNLACGRDLRTMDHFVPMITSSTDAATLSDVGVVLNEPFRYLGNP
jgi:hypothetical protein